MTEKEVMFWAAVRADLLLFVQQAFHEVYPGKDFIAAWYVEAIIHQLEEVMRGRQRRLIVNLPPRYGKSFLISVAWVAFVLGNDPKARVMCVSYSDELRKTLTRDFNRIVESLWYRRLFPDAKFKRVTDYESNTDQNGGRYAMSVGGSITGRGADIIIIDDPIKPEDALSDKARRSTNEWVGSTLMSRLDDKARSPLILVMQRLHAADLTEHLYAGGGFTKLSLPAIATGAEVIALRDGRVHRRVKGGVLHAEREDLATLTQLRHDMGPYNFASQYQQAPEMPEGALFKRDYFKLVSHVPSSGDGAMYVSVDTATAVNSKADFSVFTLIYVNGPDIYLMDVSRVKVEYEELRDIALKYLAEYEDITFVIEDVNNGTPLLQHLRRQFVKCISYKPSVDKVSRAYSCIDILSQGRVKLFNRPGKNAWIPPLLTELLAFPFGRYDDQVDSLTQFLGYADRRHNPRGRVYPVGLIDSRGYSLDRV